jgi:hypothetical protein
MGPVGVGKSIQIKLLQDYFKSKDTKVIRTFIKSNHGLAYITVKLLTFLNIYKSPSHQNGLNVVYLKETIAKRLYPVLSFLDTISIVIKFFFSVYIPFHLGFTVLIEEGLLMTLFTYVIANPNLRGIDKKVPLFILRLIGWIQKQKNMNIILEAEEEELILRRKNRSYRRYESPHFVNLQKKWLERLHNGNTFFIETTNFSIQKVHMDIVSTIEKCMQLAN